jgi:hypothetical protein
MKQAFIVAALFCALFLKISAQEASPNTTPAAAPKSGSSIGKLNGKQETDNSHKAESPRSPIPTIIECSEGCTVENPHTQSEAEKAKANSLDTLYRRYMWATIIGVFGAWIGIIILIIQTAVMGRNSKRQLRAYVVQEMGAIVNVADPIPAVGLVPTEARLSHPEWGPIIRLQIKNTGQTPALEVTNWAAICFREYPLVSELPGRNPQLRPMPSILGAGIPSTKTLFFGPPLTAQQITDLRAGTGAIYFHGEIQYRDIFNKTHFTRYRGMHHVMGGAIGVSTDLTFTEGGNEAD